MPQPLEDKPQKERNWRRIATWSLVIFLFVILGQLIHLLLPFSQFLINVSNIPEAIDKNFLLMILIGFAAQLVDGALGMGYGVTCTTSLLAMGINLPVISGSIHTAEMFSSGRQSNGITASHYSYARN